MSCPCGAGEALETCCGPYLSGETIPATAEALMRSRYTAYSQGAVDYIRDTSAAAQRAAFSMRDATAWANAADFQHLEILETVDGGPDDDTGVVDFAATWVESGQTRVLRERSRFVREDGAWRYAGGSRGGDTVRRDAPKVGRNDPCPCGSGKKFKKCCGR